MPVVSLIGRRDQSELVSESSSQSESRTYCGQLTEAWVALIGQIPPQFRPVGWLREREGGGKGVDSLGNSLDLQLGGPAEETYLQTVGGVSSVGRL